MLKKLSVLVAGIALAIGMSCAIAAPDRSTQYDVKAQQAAPQMCLAVDAKAQAAPVQSVKIGVPAVDYAAVKAKLEAGDAFGAAVALLFGAGGVGWAMTTLAANKSRVYELGDDTELPVVATDTIYEGAAVGYDGTSIARPLVAGDKFCGFAQRKADNQTVAGAAGAINVLVKRRGIIKLPITNTVVGDIGKAVYASDDDTFTLTQSTNSYVGRVVRNEGTGTALVAFDADAGTMEAELVDSSGGTGDGTMVAISATFVQAEVRNNFADLAAKVNHLLRIAKGGA